MRLTETCFALKDGTPQLVESRNRFGSGLFRRWVDIGVFIDGIELPSFDRIGKDLESLLDTFEERVIFGGAGGGTFIRVVTKDFLAMGAFDLGVSGSITVFRETENSVVILSLE